MRRFTSLLFAGGLAFLLFSLVATLDFGDPPMRIGSGILAQAPAQVGTANIVTAVVLAYRGIDTLGELSILFAAATAAGLVLARPGRAVSAPKPGGFVLRVGADLLLPLLVVIGLYIIAHGHLTPGGGFQGGVILAAAFFLPLLASPGREPTHAGLSLVEGLAGGGFILIGLLALWQEGAFLEPLLGTGQLGALLSGGTLPLLYLAVGLKVGAELSALLARLMGEGHDVGD